jgi:hypothetical protein
VVQAHPFRQRDYIRKVVLSTGCVDAVEAANATNGERSCDALALRYARKLGLPITAGSDMHNAQQIWSGGVFGVYLEKKMQTVDDYVQAILNNRIGDVYVRGRHCDYYGDESVETPVEIRDRHDRVTGENWRDYII